MIWTIIIGFLLFFAISALVVAYLIMRAPLVGECDCEECRRLRGEFVEPAEDLTDLSSSTAGMERMSQNEPGYVPVAKASRCCASRAHQNSKTAPYSWFSSWKSHTPH